MLGFITWDFNPEIVEGYKTPNYYGLLFVSGLVLGYFVIRKMFRKEEVPDAKLDKLLIYVIIATIVGARLGHVLFYGPYWDSIDNCGKLQEGYFQHPLSIFKVWEGGLASHGGALALLLALWLYSRNVMQKPVLWIFDRISAPIAIAGTFIRLGNFANSEIVGDPSDAPWAISFPRFYNEELCTYDPTPRHPTMLYEAISYLIIFAVLMFFYWKRDAYKKPGIVFGIFLVLLFSARFFIEFIKLGQTARDSSLTINTGQMLSIPFVLLGIYLLVRKQKQSTDLSA